MPLTGVSRKACGKAKPVNWCIPRPSILDILIHGFRVLDE